MTETDRSKDRPPGCSDSWTSELSDSASSTLERASELPAVAAVLVAYGSTGMVEAAVASLREGSARPVWIGVVDHSPAGSPPPQLPDGVTLVLDPANPGFAAGVNRLAALAPPDADLFLLNPDATVGRETLFVLGRLFASDERLAAATVPIRHEPPRPGLWFAGGRVRAWLADLRHRRSLPPNGATDFVTGAAMWIRRSAWLQVGQLDPSFFLYGEDVDWCLRARASGWRLAIATDAPPEAYATHRGSATILATERGGDARTYYIARSTVRLALRHARRWQVMAFGIPRLVWAGLRVRAHRSWFRGMRDGWVGQTGPMRQAP